MAERPYIVYVRRSLKREGDADVSDETQEAVARERIPSGAAVLVVSDSGGHHSGYSTDRPGYRRLLELIRTEAITGIAAFDDSRLNRNAENALALYRECAAHGIRLLTSATPSETLFSSTGKTVYGIGALISEQYRNDQSARMKAMATRTFEQGRHRGADPFGYKTERDDLGRVVHPRHLVVCGPEAEVVRRVFRELAERPFSEVSDLLNTEGSLRPASGSWTADAVKAVWDRRWIYAGHVTHGHRHRDHRPGHHQAIITEQEFLAALGAIERRKRGVDKPTPSSRRTYLLSGMAFCSCGARMRGDARVHGGREYRYLACPVADGRGRWVSPDGGLMNCNERRIRAEVAEQQVLDAITGLAFSSSSTRAACPEPSLSANDLSVVEDERRRRFEVRLSNLRKQHEWGDIDDETYRRARDRAERELMLLPSLTEAGSLDPREVAAATLDSWSSAPSSVRRELIRRLVARVRVFNGTVSEIEWCAPLANGRMSALAGDLPSRSIALDA